MTINKFSVGISPRALNFRHGHGVTYPSFSLYLQGGSCKNYKFDPAHKQVAQ